MYIRPKYGIFSMNNPLSSLFQKYLVTSRCDLFIVLYHTEQRGTTPMQLWQGCRRNGSRKTSFGAHTGSEDYSDMSKELLKTDSPWSPVSLELKWKRVASACIYSFELHSKFPHFPFVTSNCDVSDRTVFWAGSKPMMCIKPTLELLEETTFAMQTWN